MLFGSSINFLARLSSRITGVIVFKSRTAWAGVFCRFERDVSSFLLASWFPVCVTCAVRHCRV